MCWGRAIHSDLSEASDLYTDDISRWKPNETSKRRLEREGLSVTFVVTASVSSHGVCLVRVIRVIAGPVWSAAFGKKSFNFR